MKACKNRRVNKLKESGDTYGSGFACHFNSTLCYLGLYVLIF